MFVKYLMYFYVTTCHVHKLTFCYFFVLRIPCRKNGLGMRWMTHLHPAQRLRISEAIFCSSYMPSCREQAKHYLLPLFLTFLKLKMCFLLSESDRNDKLVLIWKLAAISAISHCKNCFWKANTTWVQKYMYIKSMANRQSNTATYL